MRAKFNRDKPVKNLPDAYKKTPDSNNFKILETERSTGTDLRNSLESIDNILDINNATGKTLDLYGERVGQARGQADDEKYLLMIKARIMRTMTDGSYESVVNALCQTFDCGASEILIEDSEEPCEVKLAAVPLSVINKAGFTVSQTLALIESLLPVGVSLTSYLFEGTFEFADGEGEYNADTGFSDDEESTNGGYLGAASGDTSNVLLPI